MRYRYAVLLGFASITLLGGGCASPSGPGPLAWDVISLKDDDWRGPPRQGPLMGGPDLILRGQELRTQHTYSAPLTIEFDAMLEEGSVNGAALTCAFAPVTQPIDRDLQRHIPILLQYDPSGGGVSVLEELHGLPNRQSKTWAHSSFSLKPGSWYHVKYEVLKDGVHITVDGQVFSSGGAVVPYDPVYVYLCGWQPTNRWHVRNFSIR